jgi:hypothetical protein
MTETGTELEQFGPTDYLVVEFAEDVVPTEGFAKLLGLVDAGAVRILDLEFVTTVDGAVTIVPPESVDPALTVFDGASSGLLDQQDLHTVGDRLAGGMIAAVLVYEQLPMLAVTQAWRSAGATIVDDGPVAITDLDTALQSTEPAH